MLREDGGLLRNLQDEPKEELLGVCGHAIKASPAPRIGTDLQSRLPSFRANINAHFFDFDAHHPKLSSNLAMYALILLIGI
jgi:hypothetical protein